MPFDAASMTSPCTVIASGSAPPAFSAVAVRATVVTQSASEESEAVIPPDVACVELTDSAAPDCALAKTPEAPVTVSAHPPPPQLNVPCNWPNCALTAAGIPATDTTNVPHSPPEHPPAAAASESDDGNPPTLPGTATVPPGAGTCTGANS